MFDFVLQQITPEKIRDLLTYMPNNFFKVVDWRDLITQSATLATRWATGEGDDTQALKSELTPLLPDDVTFYDQVPQQANPNEARDLGTAALDLYFRQINNPSGLFIDLRLSCFEEQQGTWLWNPGNLWIKWGDEFRSGVSGLYKGYYGEDPVVFDEALIKLGLMKPEWTDDEKESLRSLFRSYFGEGDLVTFTIENFVQSFHKIFQFLVEKDCQLPGDFIYLGVYLVTLYLLMEELGGSYNVKQIYLEGCKQLKTNP
jgi:hypothetical protein